MLTISKTFEFAASHRLYKPEASDAENFKIFGKCSNPNGHGHNYKLEVIVSGIINPANGMILDASQLDQIVTEYIVKDLDHKHLNLDVAWLKGLLPTTEVLIEAIWQRLAPEISKVAHNIRLERLVLNETSRISVTRTYE